MRADHPDALQVRDLIDDLTAWLDIEVHDATSQFTGGGAIRYVEQAFSDLHGGRPSALLPSATIGMRAALLAAGVGPENRVLIPAVDWTSTLGAVRALGATPVLVDVDPSTMTIAPESVRHHLGPRVAAVVACHLHGVPADVPTLRDVVGHIPVIEDCAQALGSTIDGGPCGIFGDYSVFSFASKAVNAGEAAIVTSATPKLHYRLIELTAHPVRQILDGVSPPTLTELSARVAPACAIQLAVALSRWERRHAVAQHNRVKDLLTPEVQQAVLGNDGRRENAAPSVPIRSSTRDGLPYAATRSTALDIASVIEGHPQNAHAYLVGQPSAASPPRLGKTRSC